MIKILTVFPENKPRRDILKLKWTDGTAEIIYANELIRGDVERWIAGGIREWILHEGPDWFRFRYTTVDDPQFLEVMGEYIRRQTNFRYTIETF